MKISSKKPHPCGCGSLSIFEIVFPKWVFPVEYFFLFGGQFVGIIPEHVEDFAFVKGKQVFAL